MTNLITSIQTAAANVSLTAATARKSVTFAALPSAVGADITKGAIISGAFLTFAATKIAKSIINRAENGTFENGVRVDTVVNYKAAEKEIKLIQGLAKYNADIRRMIKRAGYDILAADSNLGKKGDLVKRADAPKWANFSALMSDRGFTVRTTTKEWAKLMGKYAADTATADDVEDLQLF